MPCSPTQQSMDRSSWRIKVLPKKIQAWYWNIINQKDFSQPGNSDVALKIFFNWSNIVHPTIRKTRTSATIYSTLSVCTHNQPVRPNQTHTDNLRNTSKTDICLLLSFTTSGVLNVRLLHCLNREDTTGDVCRFLQMRYTHVSLNVPSMLSCIAKVFIHQVSQTLTSL